MRLARFALLLPLILTGWQQPVPTYSIHITGEPGAMIWVEGSYERFDGTVVPITRFQSRLDFYYHIYADHHLRLKIETETPVEAQAFYEYRDVKEWLATKKGIKGSLITFDIPARP